MKEFKSFSQRSGDVRSGKVMTPEIEKSIYEAVIQSDLDFKKEQALAFEEHRNIVYI